MKEKESPIFPDYPTAAKYFQLLDSPLQPSTSQIFDLAGAPIGSGEASWRVDMESQDPKVNPMLMNRRQRKLKARSLWQAESKAFKDQLNSR